MTLQNQYLTNVDQKILDEIIRSIQQIKYGEVVITIYEAKIL